MMDLRGKKVLVAGLGRSGVAAANFLHQRGALVTANDSQELTRIPAAAELSAMGIKLIAGEHPAELFETSDLIVVSPGIPLSLEPFQRAAAAGVKIVSEIELASWFIKGRVIGITGTNGKTTTTTLIGEILSQAGKHTLVGGNIGRPMISLVDESTDETFNVIELSSFQLEAVESLHVFAAILLNITPDHLDRYSSMDEYASAKANIFRNQTREDLAVLNADDPLVAEMKTEAHKVFFSCRRELKEGLFLSGNEIVSRSGAAEKVLITVPEIGIKGAHNLENVMSAMAVALVCGVSPESMRETVKNFRGVEHRLEFVRSLRGVSYYNDSKATNVDSAIKALEAFESGVIVILGGKDKGTSYAPLVPLVKSRCRDVILIGAAAERIAEALAGAGSLHRCGTMEDAVHKAAGLATEGNTVLLAPACASFDMFDNYEHRGRVFKAAVAGLS